HRKPPQLLPCGQSLSRDSALTRHRAGPIVPGVVPPVLADSTARPRAGWLQLLSADPSGAIPSALDDLTLPWWVGGLVVAIVCLGGLGLPLSGEALEWTVYLMVGALVPALAIAVALPRERGPARRRAIGAARALLATAGLL